MLVLLLVPSVPEVLLSVPSDSVPVLLPAPSDSMPVLFPAPSDSVLVLPLTPSDFARSNSDSTAPLVLILDLLVYSIPVLAQMMLGKPSCIIQGLRARRLDACLCTGR